MENFGLSSEVKISGKSFQVQTTYSHESAKIISSIFENGRVVDKREIPIEKDDISQEEIKSRAEELHSEMAADLELLFYVSEKVRTIKHAVSSNKLGLVFLKKNLIDEAIEEFSRAIRYDPELTEAYNNLGIAYLRKEEYDKAIDVLKRRIDNGATYADLRNTLGLAYLARKEYPEAIAEFMEALEINPSYGDAHFNLGLALLKSVMEDPENSLLPQPLERQKEASEHLQEATTLVPQLRIPEIEQGIRFLRDGEYSEALQALSEGKEKVEESIDNYFEHDFYLKFMFGGKGKDERFIRVYTDRLKAEIDKHPDYADLRNNLGMVYLIQCRNLFLKALEEFRKALKINPFFKKAEKNLKLAENEGKGFIILLRALFK